MKKLVLAMQVTLDGFCESEDGMSWMKQDTPEQWQDMFGFLHNVDTMLLGRGMWAEYRDYWKDALNPGTQKTPDEVAYARIAEKTRHIIFSKSLKETGWENAEINAGDVVSEIRKIKQGSGKDIHLVGGPTFAGTVLDAGLVDVLTLSIHPFVAGKGKSFFRNSSFSSSFELQSSKTYSNQVVILNYQKI